MQLHRMSDQRSIHERQREREPKDEMSASLESGLQNLEGKAKSAVGGFMGGGFDAKVVAGVLGYCLCSSTMLLINKMAMGYVPVASLVNTVQMVFAAVVVYCLKYSGCCKVDDFEMEKVKAYAIYSFGFALGIYCNMRALALSNMEIL